MIVVSYNTREALRSLLSVWCQLCVVIVVDNASSDGSVEMVASDFPQAFLIRNSKNVGFGKAVNQGLARGQTEFFLIVNPDINLPVETVDAMLKLMSEWEQIGICGPEVVDLWPRAKSLASHRESTKISRDAFLAEAVRERHGQFNFATVRVRMVYGCCLMIRDNVIKQIGGFDPAFFMYFEDDDICVRASEAGYYVVLLLGARIAHQRSMSDRRLHKIFCRFVVSAAKYYLKHNPIVRLARRGHNCPKVLLPSSDIVY